MIRFTKVKVTEDQPPKVIKIKREVPGGRIEVTRFRCDHSIDGRICAKTFASKGNLETHHAVNHTLVSKKKIGKTWLFQLDTEEDYKLFFGRGVETYLSGDNDSDYERNELVDTRWWAGPGFYYVSEVGRWSAGRYGEFDALPASELVKILTKSVDNHKAKLTKAESALNELNLLLRLA